MRECRRRSRLLSPCDVFGRCPQWKPLASGLRLSFPQQRPRRIYSRKSWQIITEGNVCEIDAFCQGREKIITIKGKNNQLRGSVALVARQAASLCTAFCLMCESSLAIRSQSADTVAADQSPDFYVCCVMKIGLRAYWKTERYVYILSPPSLSLSLLWPISSRCCQS